MSAHAARVLEIEELTVRLVHRGVAVTPVDGVTFAVHQGEIVGIAGESGSGKTMTLRAIMGLQPRSAVVAGTIRLAPGPADGRRPHRGIAMVFQEPFNALNPTMRVGDLVAEGVRACERLPSSAIDARVQELLDAVGMPDPPHQARMWPHQLSGGLRQRVMIAVALSTRPRVLLCDEPTTALDVSVQDQILGLLAELRRDTGMAIVFVTHDLASLAEICDRVNVMYAGQIVESGPVSAVFGAPRHRYTEALLRAVPALDRRLERLADIPGQPPDPAEFPAGCRFAPRCGAVQDDCRLLDRDRTAARSGDTRASACVHPPTVNAR